MSRYRFPPDSIRSPEPRTCSSRRIRPPGGTTRAQLAEAQAMIRGLRILLALSGFLVRAGLARLYLVRRETLPGRFRRTL